MTILFLLPDQSQSDYEDCKYPARGKEDTDEASSDFRDQHPKSPLTEAGFKITPVGLKLRSARDVGPIQKNRMIHGRIAGYLVNFNPPACAIGHNRLLVNGVPFAARLGEGLLKYWLVDNGCTARGLAATQKSEIRIISVTPTYLFKLKSEHEARLVLSEYRARTETLCNPRKSVKGEKVPAYSYPPKPQDHATTYTYTAYVKRRQYLIDCYVKVPGVLEAYFNRIPNEGAEFDVAQDAIRTLRIGVKLHGKWLEDESLNLVQNWVGEAGEQAYRKAFELVRSELRLDDNLRQKQLRSPTVKTLNLPKKDQALLLYHLKGNIAREHEMFRMVSPLHASKAYSASKKRIYDRIQVDLDIAYSGQLKTAYPKLVEVLQYPGEYIPSDRVAPFVYSRVSVPAALEKLEKLIAEIL